MNEKRAFKIYCNKHILGSQNKYILLFDTLDKSDCFNESQIKEMFSNRGYSSQYFSSDKNYLIKTILKSLNEFHSEKTADLKIKHNLISIEILFYKGLYEECLNLIHKTKRIKLSDESQYLILELIKWEKKCVGYSKGLLGAIKTNNLLDDYFENIKYEKLITDLYYKSYYYRNSVGKISKKKLIDKFDTLFKSPVFKSDFIYPSIHIKIFYYLIYANYYFIKNDSKQELNYLRQVIVFFNKNEQYKFEKPLDYISIYIRIIDINKYDETSSFYDDIKSLRQFDKMIKIQDNVAQERIFIHTYQAELEYLLNFNKFEESLTIMEEIQQQLIKKKYKIEPYYLIAINYLFAATHMSLGQFSKALKCINVVLNEHQFSQRPTTFIKTEFLNLVIHFELKNFDLVEKGFKQLKQKYKSAFKLNYIERELSKTISKIIDNPNIINERVVFRTLNQKLIKNKSKVNTSELYKHYINYIDYKLK